MNVDQYVSASILYARPHTLIETSSVHNPFFKTLLPLDNDGLAIAIRNTGRALWEAGDMAGFFNTDGVFISKPKKPFPDSYDEWSESFRGLGKRIFYCS